MISEEFKFPKMYIEMNELGWLNISSDPDKYLWLCDLEWYKFEEIQNYEYEEDEYQNIVPFAHTGGGDKWVWYLEASGKMAVGLCCHDDTEGTFYAENLEGAIFRNILEFVSNSYFYINSSEAKSYQLNVSETRNYLVDWRNRFDKWFNVMWLKELDELIKLDFKYCHTQYGDYYALITPEEAGKKIEKYINFDLINKTFAWCD